MGNDGGSAIAPLQQFRTSVEPQISLGFIDGVTVAGEAVPGQQGPDPALEELQLGRLFRLGRQSVSRADPAGSEDGTNQQGPDPEMALYERGHMILSARFDPALPGT